ncbi:MAG: 2-dehydro-3-deoxygalactonokinase [Pseudomonadota bacterium]
MPSDSAAAWSTVDPASIDWVAVDWGTSQLRIWAMDRSGSVLSQRQSNQGMGKLLPHEFELTIRSLIQDWLELARTMRILACGMVGARGGWCEAPYRTVPGVPVVADGLAVVRRAEEGMSVQIVPGLAQHDPPDVMRGEETQLAGLVAHGCRDATVCLPGSHSKWVRMADGCVTSFNTSLTGEAFAALANHTVLRHSVSTQEGDDHAEFCAAVREALVRPNQVLSALFGLRSAALLNGLSSAAASARLSGWLIGLELAGNEGYWQATDRVELIGEPALSRRYAQALELVDVASVRHDASALTVAGLASLNRQLED